MPYISWEDVDKVRDAVALTRAKGQGNEDQFGALIQPYTDGMVRTAMSLYRFGDDSEMAEFTNEDPPDHQERWNAFIEQVGQLIDVLKAKPRWRECSRITLGETWT
jgi:hypothetical protein